MTSLEKLSPDLIDRATPTRLAPEIEAPKTNPISLGLGDIAPTSEGGAENDEAAYDLSKLVQKLPRLSEESELRICQRMATAARDVLAMACEECSSLTALADFIELAEEDMARHLKEDEAVASAEALDLPGLIDELQLLLHLSEEAAGREKFVLHHRVHSRRRRLQRKLAEWPMPAYMVINRLVPELEAVPLKATLARDIQRAKSRFVRQRNRMAQGNMRLVYSVAAKFRYLGLPYEDLVQEGSLGLIKAIERYRPARGFRFSTYAYRVISQSIHLALDKQSSLVRKPFKLLREKAAVEQTRQKLEQQLGRQPRGRQLTEALPDSIADKATHVKDLQLPTADDHHLYAHSPDPADHASYSEARQDRETAFLHDRAQLEDAISTLPERAQLIVRMRFGLGVAQSYTLEEISQRLGLSRERVRQIAKQGVADLQQVLGVQVGPAA